MGFFEKSFLGKVKDVVIKGPQGVFNEQARQSLPMAHAIHNLDGTMNPEAVAASQAQAMQAYDKPIVKQFLAPDVAAGYKKMAQDAFQRQNTMVEMMNEHVKAKQAGAEGAAKQGDGIGEGKS